MNIIKKFTLLFALISFASPAMAEHPIPQDSASPWDYRGEPRTITRKSHDALFACKTYEELTEALILAIKDLEHEPDCSAPVYVASGCRLALIRAYYIMGETEKADKLLERYAAVYRKQDGTPDYGEKAQENTENNKPNKAEMATPRKPSD